MKTNFTESRQFFNGRPNLLKKSLLALIILTLLSVTRINAQSYVNLVVAPAITNTTIGQSITVQVNAQFTAGNPIDAIQANLTYDPAVLQATAVTNVSGELTSFVGPNFNNTTGLINFVGVDLATPYLTANSPILSITFSVIGVPGSGSTNLAFNRPPTEVAFAALSVLNTTTNGVINISSAGCTPPTATISAASSCDAKPFNLILAASPAPTGTAPFDLTINGTTYNNIPVGGIITSFTPPSTRIWPATPATPPTFEDASITLGVQFKSSVTGFVKGVRFFSPDDVPATPGTFTGQLWTTSGLLLASGTFTSVTADSWNELLFSEPILITAATTYVASYHTDAIKYVRSTGGLSAPVTNGPLTAQVGGGVFAYGATPTYPSISNPDNYWADVIFAPNNYTFNLTGIKDALECTSTGTPNLQTLNVTSVDCSTLPVSLISFSATPGSSSVTLRWSTSSEINNLGFEVQRSIDGSGGWTTLSFVNGAGNSTSIQKYSYVDENLIARRYYYRLKQVDIDKRYEYSPIVSAVLDGDTQFALDQNYPNPFRTETVIRFTLPQRAKVNLSLFDMNGRLVRVLLNESKESGTHAVTFNSGILTRGLYYYKLQTGELTAVKKMTIQ
jgi:hypothetical protein